MSNSDEALDSRATVDRPLSLGFGLLVMLTFGLIVLGALVRANGAGLACPDWPLCFGNFVPQMDVRVAFEWTHRLVAGSVAAIFVALAVLTWRARSGTLRWLLVVAAGLLVAQIGLGALTVWLKLAPWTVTAHLILGNGFAATIMVTAATLRDRADSREGTGVASKLPRAWITFVAVLVLLQMVLGGLVSSRYAGMACPEWPTCSGGVWFPSWSGSVGVHLLHRFNGYLLVACLGIAAWISRREPRLRVATRAALLLGLGQLGAGIANVLTGIPVELTAIHSALAAALVLTVALALRATWSGCAAAG